MVVEKLVKCYREFLVDNCDETYHYPIEQHLNYQDTPGLIYLKIFENIDYLNARILAKNLSYFLEQLHQIIGFKIPLNFSYWFDTTGCNFFAFNCF